MEGFAVLRESERAGVPAIQLRGISNRCGNRETSAWDFAAGAAGSDSSQQKRAAYGNATRFLRLALQTPSGFASDEARMLSRLAESDEVQAALDTQQLPAAPFGRRESLSQERGELRRESESSMRRAKELLVAGNVSATDPNYQMVILGMGDTIFGREVGATYSEKVRYYQEALDRYREAETLLPGDPRPLLDQGICYERLTGIATSVEEKQRNFAASEAILRRALTLNLDSPDYSPATPYRELAVLYTHMNDYASAVQMLKRAQQARPGAAESADVARDIRNLEEFLARQGARK